MTKWIILEDLSVVTADSVKPGTKLATSYFFDTMEQAVDRARRLIEQAKTSDSKRDPLHGVGPGSEVKVEWEDSCNVSNGWVTFDQAITAELSQCVTYGFVVGYASAGRALAIAQSTGKSHVCNVILIPTSAIIKVTKI